MKGEFEVVLDEDTRAVMRYIEGDDVEHYVHNHPNAVSLVDQDWLWYEGHDGASVALSKPTGGVVFEAVFGVAGAVPPTFVIWQTARRLFCGVGDSVIDIEWANGEVRRHQLVGQFIDFVLGLDSDVLVCWQEGGIMGFGRSGEELWFWPAPDVLASVTVSGDAVVVRELAAGTDHQLGIRSGIRKE